jgi:hypothetical protein
MKAPLLKVNFRWSSGGSGGLLTIQDVLPGKLHVQIPNVRHNSLKLETKEEIIGFAWILHLPPTILNSIYLFLLTL